MLIISVLGRMQVSLPFHSSSFLARKISGMTKVSLKDENLWG